MEEEQRRGPHPGSVDSRTVEGAPYPILRTDRDGRWVYANAAACAALGWSRDSLLCASVWDVLPAFSAATWPARWAEMTATGALTLGTEQQTNCGGRTWMELDLRFFSDGGREYADVFLRDVSAWRETYKQRRIREERLRVIFDLSQAGIILVDPRGTITYANQRMAEMFGFPLDEFIGSTYPEHVHPDQRGRGDERMKLLIRGEIDRVSSERHYIRKDGSEFWGHLSGRRHEDSEGGLISLVGVVADVTEQKQAEEALRKSEERFRTLVDLAADTILQGDMEGVIIGANQSAEALTGYPAADLLGRNIAVLFSEEERTRVPLRYDLLMAGHVVRNERVLTRRDGSLVPIEMNSKRMPDGSYQTFIRDCSERRRSEDVLRASEEKFARAFRHAPLLMTISSLEDGRYLDVNDKFCDISGFSREEAIGRTSVELGWVTARDRERLIAELREKGRVEAMTLDLTAKDGRRVHCVYNGETLVIGEVQRLLSIAVDVTEEQRMRGELDRAQKLESLGVLAGGIAHDFNNILTGILGNLSFARSLVGADHPATPRLADCEKAAVRASELTQQLVTFARGGAPVRKRVDTVRLVNEAVDFALHGSNVRAATEFPDDLPLLDADEGQVAQVFNNLLINARQAMPDGGTVTIRAAGETVGEGSATSLAAGRYVRFDVADNGSGIPREILGRIFDPYFSTKAAGTGLGLSSVYSIVHRHGGHVGVASEPGRGSTFTLYLPAANENVPDAGRPEAELRPLGKDRGTRVLVMDDEEFIRDLATAVLEELGYSADSCPDGAVAVARVQEALDAGRPFGAVILDLTIPGGMGGKEAAARIGEIDPSAALVVSTGYSNDPVVADYRSHGFRGAIVKPYTMATLARELSRALAKDAVPPAGRVPEPVFG